MFVYDDKSTMDISGGGDAVLKESTRAKQSFTSTAKLAHCWTGPYKILFVGPGKINKGEEVGAKIL